MLRILGCALGLLVLQPAWADGNRIAADAAWVLAGEGALTIVDVRTPGEWQTTGLAQGAVGIPVGTVPADVFVRRVLEAVDGDLTRAVAVICAAGVRSARAAGILERNGFLDVRDIGEGMSGWLARGLPLHDPS